MWKNHRIEVIPNGLPLDVYQPLDRVAARRALGVRSSGLVILAAASNIADPRKGSAILVEALQQLTTLQPTLLTFGAGAASAGSLGIPHVDLGPIDFERAKTLAYNAADLYVHSALADNLPNVALEALACGTPIVSFAVGGLPEIVRPGRTGWLARAVTSEALAEAMQTAISDLQAGGATLRATCRGVAVQEYGLRLQAARYLSLFESLTAPRVPALVNRRPELLCATT
jgi:glycosyltransferase involved in cell wall biosynthesis